MELNLIQFIFLFSMATVSYIILIILLYKEGRKNENGNVY